MKNAGLLFLLSIVFFNSCSFKKRAYRKGYYIDWVFQKENKSENKNHSKKHSVSKIKSREYVTNDPEFIVASAGNLTFNAVILANAKKSADTICGDLLTLKKGSDYFKVKVVEVNETQIKYKRCDNLDGPLIIVHKNDVYSIKYKNGITEHFERIIEKEKDSPIKQIHPDAESAVIWLVCTIFLSIAGLILALIFAARAKRKILAEPHKYTGLKTVKVVQIIALTLLIIALVLGTLFMIVLLGI